MVVETVKEINVENRMTKNIVEREGTDWTTILNNNYHTLRKAIKTGKNNTTTTHKTKI
jgi:uncharacterized protein YheU (UPF0270 family)